MNFSKIIVRDLFTDDINELIVESPIHLGTQNWSSGRITRLEAGNYFQGGNITLHTIPESIGNLSNLQTLWIFDNQLSTLPESICNLDLDWNGDDENFAPYFGSGGNLLCDTDNIPDCVENSANFEIALDQFYYSFMYESEQECDTTDVNDDGQWNILDVVLLVNVALNNEYNSSGDFNSDGVVNILDVVALVNIILS